MTVRERFKGWWLYVYPAAAMFAVSALESSMVPEPWPPAGNAKVSDCCKYSCSAVARRC